MRQAIMTSPGVIEFREMPKPESLGLKEVLLKIDRIGVWPMWKRAGTL
jgi:hypothetical protein